MARMASLGLFLFVFWLLLSGHYTVWLIGAGLIVSALLAVGAHFLGLADEEGHPVNRLGAGLAYWPWLAVEIIKSSVDVARIILNPKLPIAPEMFETKVGPRTPVGVATYANSITLTPGTITVEVDRERDTFLVHALTRAGADGVRGGEMDRRVTRFEGRAA
ncbi:Na+/H+ antiporter subunit E [Kaistia dalseonensis]|uniref:Multicomponent Na+:H+ antiporter subunit E n=1 Tax=Kaistia dalseonensis TaxID=410840 RepID=A0ABU0HD39_9HYPH|nr:Na+/H+ antiporter subunit E [Kaistia dalseonensis]MCX5497601.1 Na+/H+ antiporter subunit E [Kaistia dalseonensis]MDQ0440243.1 multicomponent Na+:H+ antiporter subunit E [Kaistia dalseonensis]